jgi:hypothetical protein
MDNNNDKKIVEGTLAIRADNRPDTAIIRLGTELYSQIRKDLPIGTLLSFRYDEETKELCFKPHKYKEE